jgi:hypothetical protein
VLVGLDIIKGSLKFAAVGEAVKNMRSSHAWAQRKRIVKKDKDGEKDGEQNKL